jgi:hypothetical protein
MKHTTMFSISIAALLSSCSSDAPKGAPDARKVATVDAAPVPTPDALPACSISTPDFGDKGVLPGSAELDVATAMAPATIQHFSVLEATPITDALALELYSGITPFGTSAMPTPIVAGTYVLAGDDLNYATCGICLRAFSNASATAPAEGNFFATSGTVKITEVGTTVGSTLAFEVIDATFEEVTIDPMTFVSTPKNNNCTTKLSASFTGAMTAPMMPLRGQPPRQHLTRTK